jgi:hypothetical protein
MKEIRVGVNTLQLSEKTAGVFGGQKPNSEDILKHYLYPLLNLGIIDKVRSNIDSRTNIYSPVEAGNINTLFADPNDPRLEVTDPAYYPTKECIEESCRTILEYCSKDGGVNDRKYRLVDHEGKDITPEELVERYLYNPEVCFKEPSKEQPQERESPEGDNAPDDTNISKSDSLPPLVCSNILTEFSNKDREESTSPIDARQDEPIKPLQEWTPNDFPLVGCIYCINNGGYRGPKPLSKEDYERHIVKMHERKPAYPGPADIELYGLTLDGNGNEKGNSGNSNSKAAEVAKANLSGNGVTGDRSWNKYGSGSNK